MRTFSTTRVTDTFSRVRSAAILGAVGVVVLGASACSGEPDWASLPFDTVPTTTMSTSDGGLGAGAADTACGAPPAEKKPGIDGVDIATLAACCEGKAHCVPGDKLSAERQAKLDTCSGGFCVPDAMITGEPKRKCDSGLGDGVCVSTCVKSVRAKANLLKQQTCNPGELCAPCIDPLEGKSSGACDSEATTPAAPAKDCAKPNETTTDPTQPTETGGGFTECCGGQGKCVPEAVVPESQKDHLVAKECTAGKLCAPTEQTDANFKPQKCTGKVLTGDYEGVCLSTCIDFAFLESFLSEQGSCDANHRCLPCETFGISTGAPGCE